MKVRIRSDNMVIIPRKILKLCDFYHTRGNIDVAAYFVDGNKIMITRELPLLENLIPQFMGYKEIEKKYFYFQFHIPKVYMKKLFLFEESKMNVYALDGKIFLERA